MTILHDYALWIAVGFPIVMIGMQALLFAFPSKVGRVEGMGE